MRGIATLSPTELLLHILYQNTHNAITRTHISVFATVMCFLLARWFAPLVCEPNEKKRNRKEKIRVREFEYIKFEHFIGIHDIKTNERADKKCARN